MYMIGHQNICVDGTSKFIRVFFQMMKIKLVILLRVETYRSIISTLNDMPGNACYG
jgi:hypothetical protein